MVLLILHQVRAEFIDKTPSNIQFTVTGAGIASTGDLAYVYGNTLINDKPENYLRIWRKEKQGWKIALEVLRY
jgi:ketosteroid isomerase-like protein